MYEKELNNLEASFRNTDLIVIIDRQGKILYYNNFSDTINKFNNSDTLGRYIWEIYPWVKSKKTPLFKVMETGEQLVNQYQSIMLEENLSISLLNSAFPIRTQNKIIGALGISSRLGKDKEDTYSQMKKYESTNLKAKYSFDDIITSDAAMNALKEKLRKAARTDSNIFICGETGTGKELFAHSIHNSSPRSGKPFISQNCAAIPETLMESTFFGTVKGSFTGAEDKKGLFEVCSGGTVFLDEINSMPLELQAKILRVVEEKSIRRIGSTKDIPVDVRLISASNEKPSDLVNQKKLRLDLFYRLNVIGVEIPPLRERVKDIELLSDYYINRFNNIFDKKITVVSPKVKEIFFRYKWPGNIREFKNAIESSFNIAEGSTINIDDIPGYLAENHNFEAPEAIGLTNMVEEFERNLISKTLVSCRYNIVHTAKVLDIPRQTLYYKLNKYRLLP
jgi:arginine utilization regulatory protein